MNSVDIAKEIKVLEDYIRRQHLHVEQFKKFIHFESISELISECPKINIENETYIPKNEHTSNNIFKGIKRKHLLRIIHPDKINNSNIDNEEKVILIKCCTKIISNNMNIQNGLQLIHKNSINGFQFICDKLKLREEHIKLIKDVKIYDDIEPTFNEQLIIFADLLNNKISTIGLIKIVINQCILVFTTIMRNIFENINLRNDNVKLSQANGDDITNHKYYNTYNIVKSLHNNITLDEFIKLCDNIDILSPIYNFFKINLPYIYDFFSENKIYEYGALYMPYHYLLNLDNLTKLEYDRFITSL